MNTKTNLSPIREKFTQDVRELFSSDVGRRVLYGLIDDYRVLSPHAYTTDPIEIAIEHGRKSVVLGLIQMLDEDALITIKESKNHERDRRAQSRGI